MVKVIDTLNYYLTAANRDKFEEFHKEEGIACKLTAVMPGGAPYHPVDELISLMDEAGVEKVFLAKLLMFSYFHKKPYEGCSLEELAQVIKGHPNRFVGLATYNPNQIMESLREIEKAVKVYGFKGVYMHIFGFDIPLHDRKMYPLYTKCVELGIPCCMQVGYVLEGMPSEHARPIYLDRIALDFPELVIVGTHTGYPWCEELVAVAYKFQNVYFGVSAHFPKYMDPTVVRNIDSRLRDKSIFGTNGLPFKPMLSQINELGLREEAKNKLLRENAIKVFKL